MRNQRAGLADLAVLRQRARHLQRHHRAAEEPDQHHDGQAADADDVHLQHDIVAVMRAAEDVPEGPAGEQEELLNRENRLFQQIQQVGRSPNSDATIQEQ